MEQIIGSVGVHEGDSNPRAVICPQCFMEIIPPQKATRVMNPVIITFII